MPTWQALNLSKGKEMLLKETSPMGLSLTCQLIFTQWTGFKCMACLWPVTHVLALTFWIKHATMPVILGLPLPAGWTTLHHSRMKQAPCDFTNMWGSCFYGQQKRQRMTPRGGAAAGDGHRAGTVTVHNHCGAANSKAGVFFSFHKLSTQTNRVLSPGRVQSILQQTGVCVMTVFMLFVVSHFKVFPKALLRGH